MSFSRRQLLKDCAIAVTLSAAASALRFVTDPAFGSRAPLLFQALAVAIAAQIAGTFCGLLVTAIGAAVIDWFAPASDVHMHAVLAIFAVVGIALSFFGGWRRNAEEALQRAHDRLALAHDVARIGTFEWFIDHNRVEWSPEMEKLYGLALPGGEHSLQEWKALVHPDDLPSTIAAMRDAVRHRRALLDTTYRILRPDGQAIWIHSRGRYDYDASGRAVHMLGVNMDVTDLKQGEIAQQILGGLLKVCSACRRIHDSNTGEWYSMEGYLRRHIPARFSHGMCPDCGRQWYSDELGQSGPPESA